MSPTEAATKLKEKVKIKTVKECRDYGSDYLFVAFETNTPYDEIDPFYLVNKSTGNVRKYNIAEDTNKFYSSNILNF